MHRVFTVVGFMLLTLSGCGPAGGIMSSGPDSRLILNSESGTVYDSKTGLTWTACPLGQTLREGECSGQAFRGPRIDFVRRAKLLEFGGHDDWRLPTADELLTLLDCGRWSAQMMTRFDETLLSDEELKLCSGRNSRLGRAFPAARWRGESWRQFMSGTFMPNHGGPEAGIVVGFKTNTLFRAEPRQLYAALLVRSSSADYSPDVAQAVYAPKDPREGRKMVLRRHTSDCRASIDRTVRDKPDRIEGSRVAFDEVLEVTLLFPVPDQGSAVPRYYAAYTENHGVVYINRQAVASAFSEADKAPYEDAQFADYNSARTMFPNRARRTCMFVLGIDEYNARMNEIAQKVEKERLAAQEKARSERLAEEQERERRMEKIRERMARPSPQIGMTRDQVRYNSNYGEPDQVNRTVTEAGVQEQWVYRSTYSRRYLYFRNGILYAIQD